MNIKSRYFFFVLIITLFLATACSSNPVNETGTKADNFGILWEVSQSEVISCYLFGTIHSEDARVTELPEPVNTAFNSANTLALEMQLDKDTAREVMKSLYFTDGRHLKPIIGDDLYFQSVKAMVKKGLPERIVNKMKPWAVFTVLNMPEQRTGLFLDAILFQTAKQQGKTIHGLETQQEQTAVFDEMSLDSQIALLKSTLENMLDMDKLQDEAIDVYLTRDLNKILALNDKYESLIDEKLAKEFTQRLVTDRNYRMVKRMTPLLKAGNCFVAVGALHLPGEEGILTLLKQQGYRVQAVY